MKQKILTIMLLACAVSGCAQLTPVQNAVQQQAQAAQQTQTQPQTLHRKFFDLSSSENKQVLSVSLEGDFTNEPIITNVYNVDMKHTGLVGRFGCPIDIASPELTSAKLQFKYNEFLLGSIPPENLIVLHHNDESFYDTVPSVLDTAEYTVTADISEDGVYMLADKYEWGSVWGDAPAGSEHPIECSNDEFNFTITMPEGVRVNYISDYLKDDEDGQYKVLMESAEKGDITVGVEYLLRPDSASAEEYFNRFADIVEQNGDMKERGVINAGLGAQGYYSYVDFGPTDGGRAFSVNCLYEYSPHEYINFWYGFEDEAEFAKVKASLESFAFVGKKQ